jgi:hypothetical protein
MTATSPENPHKWHSDRPGEQPDDDKLGRKEFAKRVAKELRAWRQKDSLVVSLNGEWGSGKTTLVNLILHYIKEESAAAKGKAPNIVRFNPWQWSGQDKVLEAFFNEIGAGFRTQSLGWWKAREYERLWKGLKVVTIAGKELADRMRAAITAVTALLAGGSGVLASFAGEPTAKHWLTGAGTVFLVISAVCAIWAPIADKIAQVFGYFAEEPKQSLEEARKKLQKKLKELESPLIVVIDDMDRLNMREIRMIVQLVKANADFPNVVYLLLYQKDIIAKALQEVTGEGGQDFLKKIVQIELEVPTAPEHLLRDFFDKQISSVIFGGTKSRWDQDRWGRLFEEAVWPWFETPRDIKRFKSMLEFYYQAHVLDSVLEVNPIDLILLEILRVFDPFAYAQVGQAFQSQRTLFVEFLFDDKDARKKRAEGIEKLVNRETLNEAARARLRSLLDNLFPQAGGDSPSGEDKLDWLRDLRICHAKMFPRYFQLGGNPGDTTDSFVNQLFTAGNDQARLRELMKSAVDGKMVTALMERLRAVRKDIPRASMGSLITALLDLSDSLPASTGGSIIDSIPERDLTRALILFLWQIENRSERVAVLRTAALASSAVTGPVMLAAFMEPEKGNPKPDSDLPVDLADLKALQSELLPRLWEAARSGALWHLRSAGYLLYRLKNWAGTEAVKAWLSESTKDSKTAASFLRVMLAESHVSGGRSHIQYVLHAQLLEDFADLEELSRRLPSEGNDQLQQRAGEALNAAIERKKAGQSYSDIYVLSKDMTGNYFVDPHPLL